MKILLLISSIICALLAQVDLKENSEVAEKLYIQLFKRKRVEQLEAIKTLRTFPYEKQFSMISLMTEKIFAVIQDSRASIESSAYIPGVSDFPVDEKIRDSLSNILENTALFCEIIIRFPDMGSSILKTNNNWDLLLQWGIAFTNQVRYLLSNSTVKLLHLASQELGHVEKDANYVNPYRKAQPSDSAKVEAAGSSKKKKKKKDIRKGPRLRDVEL